MIIICPTIPSGRLGKLADSIEKQTSKELFEELFQDYSQSLKGVNLANWVLQKIEKLEMKLGHEETIAIFEQNGRESCGKGFKNTVRNIFNKSNSIENFVIRL